MGIILVLKHTKHTKPGAFRITPSGPTTAKTNFHGEEAIKAPVCHRGGGL